MSFGADNRSRTCMNVSSYGPEPYASANSAISAYGSSQKRRNGGWGWIRTIEVCDDRFTVCSLWPLGNPSINNIEMMELVGGIEPSTC